MDGEVDDKAQGLQEAGGQAAQGEPQQQAAQKPLTGGDSPSARPFMKACPTTSTDNQ